MDILPSEEEQMLKNGAREFLEAECSTAMVREMEIDGLGYPPALWKQMADLGWLGLALPEEYGGQGLPITYLGLILEEAGRALAPVPLHSTAVAALTIAGEGTGQQKLDILPGVSDGSMVLTWAVHERDPRLIPEAMQLQATADGDGWVLNGTKMFVDNFIVAQRCLLACRTSPASDANQGISLFLVDPNGTGVAQTALTTLAKDKQSMVDFKDVRVERAALLGEVDRDGRSYRRCWTGPPPCCAARWSAPPGKTPSWPSNTPRTGWPLDGPSGPSSRCSTCWPT